MNTKKQTESFLDDIAYYFNDKKGMKTIFALSTFIVIISILCYVSIVRLIFLLVFGMTALFFGYKYFKK